MPLRARLFSTIRRFAATFGLAASVGGALPAGEPTFPGVRSVEFVYEKASFPECHASTVAETPTGLVAAWFGGAKEGHDDVGIWVARRTAEGWTAPVEVADGVQFYDVAGKARRHPCWNPVLFQMPDGPLHLFFKVGPSPSAWWGMLTTSVDDGVTWSKPIRLPERIDGPVKNKPILLDGDLLCPSSTEHDGWRIHMERWDPAADRWTRTGPLNTNDGPQAIQPTLLTLKGGVLSALCRDRNGEGSILQTRSEDGGQTWSALRPLALPNPNSGIDAVTLADGRHLLVYNPTRRSGPPPRGREKLSVAISEDGENWIDVGVLEDERGGEFSYPAVIQRKDGSVVIAYTWKRERIRVVTLDPALLRIAVEGVRPAAEGR